jgi:hypothetical protein
MPLTPAQEKLNAALKDVPVLGTFTVTLPQPTPLERACAEIRSLNMRPDLMPNRCFGSGKLTPEEIAENTRKRAERARLRLEAIARYEVEEEFLVELRKDAARYRGDLERVESQIAALEESLKKRGIVAADAELVLPLK